MTRRLFVSYSHHDGADLATRLADDLARAGHDVFIDRDRMRVGQNWDDRLATAIENADVLLAVLSPMALRREGDPGADRDSICLDEIEYARKEGKPVIPVMALPCRLPLTLTRASHIDFTGWALSDPLYRARIGELLLELAHNADLSPTPLAEEWDPDLIVKGRAEDFHGRAWLFDRVAEWIDSDTAPPLVLLGEPGIGKSAFAAELVRRDAGRHILAHFFFDADVPQTRNVGAFVRRLAIRLARVLPGYAAAIRAPQIAPLLEPAACQIDPASALQAGVIAPLATLRRPPRNAVILLDALDEARLGEREASVPDLLGRRLALFPPWLRVLATSRPEQAALRGFESARTVLLDADDPRNRADVASWLAARAGTDAAGLAERSAGSFLYARLAWGAVAAGGSVASLPPGLRGLFRQNFERSFPSAQSYAPARAALAVLLAAQEPLTQPQLAAAAGLAAIPARAAFDALSPYLHAAGERLTLHHKSLADWLGDTEAGDPRFLVDRQEGERLLAEWCADWARTGHTYAWRHYPAHLAATGRLDTLATLLREGRFAAAKEAALDDRFAAISDWGVLAAALIAAGRDREAATLAANPNPAVGDAVTATLGRLGLPRPRMTALLAALRGKGAAGRNARIAALRLAAGAGLADILTNSASAGDPRIRAAVIPQVFRLWQDDRETGWQALDLLQKRAAGWLGWPRGGPFEVLGGVSLAIISRDYADADTLRRLAHLWQEMVRALLRLPLLPLFGQRAIRLPLRPALRTLMARQPDYQPFNHAELRTAFARPREFHQPALDLLPLLEQPDRADPFQAAAILRAAPPPFDIHLMLAAERTLVLLGAHAPAAVMEVLQALHRDGPAWFHQSLLYVGFHLLLHVQAPPPGALDAYLSLAETIIADSRATLRTDSGTYRLIPHMAWPDMVLDRHRPDQAGTFLPGCIALAERLEDAEFTQRAISAAQVLSLAYRLDHLALRTLTDAVQRDDPTLRAPLATTLANIRFNAGPLVDAFLDTHASTALRRRVATTEATVGPADFPTWVDSFFNLLLLTNPGFRTGTATAFRRAATADSADAVLDLMIDWMMELIASARAG